MSLPKERRALYNLLKIRWQENSELLVEPWQVEDLRSRSTAALFKALQPFGLDFGRASFIDAAELFDSPEELAKEIGGKLSLDAFSLDRVYLLLFELWRRLVPEKRSHSIFCDELDYQIGSFQNNTLESPEALEDALENFLALLSECSDMGGDSQMLYRSIISTCAADVETFLYEFISECLDHDNIDYAIDLYEGFYPFVCDAKWFELLYVRILAAANREAVPELLEVLIKQGEKSKELEYNLEILSLLTQEGSRSSFYKAALQALDLIHTEEDLLDLLSLCADFFELNDCDEEREEIELLLAERKKRAPLSPLSGDDPYLEKLKKLLKRPVETS